MIAGQLVWIPFSLEGSRHPSIKKTVASYGHKGRRFTGGRVGLCPAMRTADSQSRVTAGRSPVCFNHRAKQRQLNRVRCSVPGGGWGGGVRRNNCEKRAETLSDDRLRVSHALGVEVLFCRTSTAGLVRSQSCGAQLSSKVCITGLYPRSVSLARTTTLPCKTHVWDNATYYRPGAVVVVCS